MAKTKKDKKSLMIVEDDPGLVKQLKWAFSDYDVFIANDRLAATNYARENDVPVVTLDLGLPPDPANAKEGLATLEEILQINPATKIIVVTGNDEKENALKAIALGAYDFYQKPVDADILGLIVERAHILSSLEKENERLNANSKGGGLDGFISISPQMSQVCRVIEKVAPSDASVLLLGESGTGKELLARAVHDLSDRKDKAFVAINCAAIPETLLESELFGYEKGAFTGAQKRTIGKIEYASEGTLFLDEIGDLSQPLQAKLLRFLQERVIERVGGREEIPVNVRIITATHQDLDNLMENDKFREDLYYRISEIKVNIPALRDRPGDALVLVKHFMETLKPEGKKPYRLEEDAIEAIESHEWPGNVRELENRVKRATLMSENNRIKAEDLELTVSDDYQDNLNLKSAREEAEQNTVYRAMTRANGKVSQAAKLLGVSRPTLYDLLEKHEISIK